MNTTKSELIEILVRNPDITAAEAASFADEWISLGYRRLNGRPLTIEYVQKMGRPSKWYIKGHRNTGRAKASRAVMAAKGRHPHGIA